MSQALPGTNREYLQDYVRQRTERRAVREESAIPDRNLWMEQAYRDLLASPRWQKLAGAGARPQRLLWASIGTKDPAASDTLYLEALAAPDTVNTIPEKTLLAFAEHGKVADAMRFDGGNAEAVLAEFTREGVNHEALAADLQREGTEDFAKSWSDLMYQIASKSEVLTTARQA